MFGIPLPLPPYEDVRSLLDDRRPTLQSALTAVVRTINSLLVDASIRASIKSRVKTPESYYDKCLRRALDSGVETEQVTLTDLLGIRIVTPFMSEIDRVEALLESEFHVVEKQRKGDDLGFWEFGYESLHYLIACPELEGPNEGLEDDTVIEIQVRTLLQDAWAEVEHELIYKSEASPLDEPMRRRLAAINANLNLADLMFQEIRDYQKNLKEQLRQRRHAFWDKVNASETSPLEPGSEQFGTGTPALPRYTDQKLLDGLIAHNQGDLERAISLYTEIINHESRRDVLAIVYLHRGMAHFSRNRLSDASRDFQSSVEADPKNEKGYLYLGVVAAAEGDKDRAMNYVEAALERNPYSMDALMERAKLRYDLGDRTGCRDDCRAVLAIDSEHDRAAQLLAMSDE